MFKRNPKETPPKPEAPASQPEPALSLLPDAAPGTGPIPGTTMPPPSTDPPEPEEESCAEHIPLPVQPEQTAMEQMRIAGEAFSERYIQCGALNECIEETNIHRCMDEIERSMKEFQSKMFFVVIFGPLKAGKSTMVNSLAHRYVSPTKLGRECTLRPSIVIQAEETGIDEYFMRDSTQDRNQVFQLVIDYVRRMKEWEDISPYIYKETSILNETNIENKLSRIVDIEPLITVIRVPGGRFVDGNTAIIDMPGLDGNISNIENSPIHNWVLSRTDFLIFIQSSISAISRTTNQFLERLLVESKNPPIWLVQNIIDGKYWRSPGERSQEALQQLSETRDEIMRGLDLKELYCTPINLGMALDGVMNHDEKLLETSQFSAFEEKLYTILQDKRIRIQERNSLHGLLRALHLSRSEIQKIQQEIQNAQKSISKIMIQFSQMENFISSHELYTSTHPRQNLEMQLVHLVTSEEDGLGKLIDDRTEKAVLYCNRDITGEELSANLLDLGESIRDKGNHLYLKTDGEFGIRIAQQINTHIERAEHFMNESLEEAQEKASRLAEPLGIQFHWLSPEELPPFDYVHLSPVMENAFRLGKNLPSTKKMLFFDRHFTGQQAKVYIQGAADSIREQLKEQAEKWIDSLMDLHVNEIRKQRKQARLSVIAENREHFRLKMDDYEGKAQSSQTILSGMEQDLNQLIELCETALQELKQVKS